MFYAIYLLTIFIYLVCASGAVTDLAPFIDTITLTYTLFPCFLVLWCTKSLKPFGHAFLSAFGRRELTLEEARGSLLSVKMAAVTSVLFGALCFMIGTINCFRHFDLAQMEDMSRLLADVTVLTLSFFYPALVCVILLPVYFLLKKHIRSLS